MSTHDLRRKVQRLMDLRRSHKARIKLSSEDMAELERGVSTEEEIEEYRQIIQNIRGIRRNAYPSKKTKAKKEAQQLTEEKPSTMPIDLNKFVDDDGIK
jgi:hypothetical protein